MILLWYSIFFLLFLQSSDSFAKLGDGRFIFYYIADEFGEIDEKMEELCITFDGNTVEELTKTLEDATGLDEIIVCTKSPLNGKLYPLSLQLPPNNTTMNVVVLPKGEALTRLEFVIFCKKFRIFTFATFLSILVLNRLGYSLPMK